MIQHIQHFRRKKHIFEKKPSFWGKNSTWPKKWFFQQTKFNMAQKVVLSAEKIQHVPKMCFFLLKKFLFRCFSVFFSSLSLSLDISLSLSAPQIPSSSALLHLCVSHSLSLSLSLPFSIYCHLLSLFLDPPPLHSLSCLLSLS